MKQLALAVSACCLCVSAHAIEMGEIVLKDVPPQAHVYVDGKPVSPKENRLHLSVGNHILQVEATRDDGIVAFRQSFQVWPRIPRQIAVTPLPVYVASPFHGGPIARYTVGPTGRPGPPGPEGKAAGALSPDALDDEALQSLIHGALETLIADLKGQIGRIRYYAAAERPRSYWYAPSGTPGPVAPPGGMGPIGPAGPAGDVLLLHTAEKRLLLDVVKESTGPTRIEQALRAIERDARSMHTEKTGAPDQNEAEETALFRRWLIPIMILTPSIKQRLDRVHKEVTHQLATIPIMDAVGQTGKSGAPGPRGKDGQTHGSAPVYPSSEQVQRLLIAVRTDQVLRDQIAKLHREMEKLNELTPFPD